MAETDANERQALPPYPVDGSRIDKAGWWIAHGPTMLLVAIAALVIIISRKFGTLVKRACP